MQNCGTGRRPKGPLVKQFELPFILECPLQTNRLLRIFTNTHTTGRSLTNTVHTLWRSYRNFGALRIREDSGHDLDDAKVTFSSILMNDLVDLFSFKKALFKMDLEGYEDKALEHAKISFREVDISYILLEWTFPLVVYSIDTARVDQFLDLIKPLGYQPLHLEKRTTETV